MGKVRRVDLRKEMGTKLPMTQKNPLHRTRKDLASREQRGNFPLLSYQGNSSVHHSFWKEIDLSEDPGSSQVQTQRVASYISLSPKMDACPMLPSKRGSSY
jgi:hypothetical protein